MRINTNLPIEITPPSNGIITTTLRIDVASNYLLESTVNLRFVAKSGILPEKTFRIKVHIIQEQVTTETQPRSELEPTEEFDFRIIVSPSSKSVLKCDSTTFTVTVELISGSPETVWLAVTGLPSAIKSFSVQSGYPTYVSTLTLDTTIGTIRGTHTIFIWAYIT